MARPVVEIEADIEAAKAAGDKTALNRLRAEKMRAGRGKPKEAEVTVAPPPTQTVSGANHVDAPAADPDYDAAVSASKGWQKPKDVLNTAEWRFIEKAIAEANVDFTSGAMTGLAKKLYNILVAKVTLWRMAHEVVEQVGVGNEWPQWSALGRNESTGRKLSEELKASPPPAPAPVPVAPRRAANFPQSGGGEMDQMKQAIAAAFRSGGPPPVPMEVSEV